jgi:hypothetical protein
MPGSGNAQRWVAGDGIVEQWEMFTQWILTVTINLIVPGLAWVTVIAGLILIVRDKVEEDDLVELLSRHEASYFETGCSPDELALNIRSYNCNCYSLDRSLG